jgi:diguanylate cyclase (GGDEF)-like protein
MDQFTLFVILAPFGCAAALMIAIFAYLNRQAPGAIPLGITLSAVALYLAFNLMELMAPDEQMTRFYASLCYLFIGIIPLGWISFAFEFTDHKQWIRSVYFKLLLIIPILAVALVFTNSMHHLIWQRIAYEPLPQGYLYMHILEHGPFFWVFWFYAYTLVSIGSIMLIYNSLLTRNLAGSQARLMAIAALPPLIANVIYLFRLIPGVVKDFSPLSYTLSGVLLALSIFRYRLLELKPLARAYLVDTLADGMITFDDNLKVVDFNPAAERIFNKPQNRLKLGQPQADLLPALRQIAANKTAEPCMSEIEFPEASGEKYFDLQIQRITRSGLTLGYLIVLHGITEHKRLLQAVQKLAEEDTLTGVFNRSRFAELAEQSLAGALKQGQPFSILMIDIDHFKIINDTRGHLDGDQILQEFTQKLNTMLRSTDILGRIGGDEFVVLLPDTSVEQARSLAQRVCSQIAVEKFLPDKDGDSPEVTISIGVASYTHDCGFNLEKVIGRADKALYQAKAQGRNRVCEYIAGV